MHELRGTMMNITNVLRAIGDPERTDPSDDTVINGVPYYANATGTGVAASRSTYWKDHPRDHGPDLDDWLDETECGPKV
jgi:hypothetical protein